MKSWGASGREAARKFAAGNGRRHGPGFADFVVLVLISRGNK